MTGQMYTDQLSQSHLRSTAQGRLTFLTYGAGMLGGSYISGFAFGFFTTAGQGAAAGRHNWTAFWLSSSCCAAAIFLLVALFFRGGGKIEARSAT
jgi:hypothetical protein